MWRLHGFFGRVVHRCHGNAPLRLSQNHCVEDEVINGLSSPRSPADSSSQRGQDGGRRGKQKTSRFCFSELPRYTALDAVGWGAAAALLMQICRRVHSQWSAGAEPGPPAPPTALHKCGYRVLLGILSTPDVFPGAKGVMCLDGLPESPAPAEPHVPNTNNTTNTSSSSSTTTTNTTNTNTSSSSCQDLDHFSIDSIHCDHQGADLNQDTSLREPPSPSSHLEPDQIGPQTLGDQEVLSGEERLAQASSSLRHVGDSSVPLILNIMGLQLAGSSSHQAAFSCFAAAARLGYSKAQFNAGVCWETGRGVAPDREKALQCYRQAAAGGHVQAQYRYAKLLLTSGGRPGPQDWSTAVGLLEQAAAAGLTQAQVFLGSVFSQEPVADGRKAVYYLKMAAESGDGRALLHLGQLYDHGFGVRRDARRAADHYERAARAGNTQAEGLLRLRREDEAALRSIHSAPCFSAVSLLPLLPHQRLHSPPGTTAAHRRLAAGLSHSWSTGSLASTPPLHLHPLAPSPPSGGGLCRWTLGV